MVLSTVRKSKQSSITRSNFSSSDSGFSGGSSRTPRSNSRKRKGGHKAGLTVVTPGKGPDTPRTEVSTPSSSVGTPPGTRGSRDLRSPGVDKTPKSIDSQQIKANAKLASPDDPLPDFITQTDRFGNAATPRTQGAIENARSQHSSAPKSALHDESDQDSAGDPCETILDSIRLMCCCLAPEDSACSKEHAAKKSQSHDTNSVASEEQESKVRLLPKHHADDVGKKCLVLDLDETLVHSSFRAVPGADFVIPVQIEDVVHFVYVAKRPGVDEFLTEMAKHYEVVIYTASLNKYADPLLDLLDPHNVIRTRLFRESCVYYEGNYVKDLSLLDRDLSQAIIVDNSPSSYIFHPENAIDCTSFIDDPNDRELDQIARFLTGVKDVKDVRTQCHKWRDWPNVDINSDSPNR